MRPSTASLVLALSLVGCAPRRVEVEPPRPVPLLAREAVAAPAPELADPKPILFLEREVLPEPSARPPVRLDRPSRLPELEPLAARCRRLATLDPGRTPCPDGEPLAVLAVALEQPTPERRDQALGALESCPTFAPGFVRALRAELLPECAVPLVERHIARQRGELDAELAETLVALHLASQARRMTLNPPAYGGGALDRYRAQRFRPWVERKVRALDELAAHAKGMDPTGHAAATLAVARAIALRRLFGAARSARVPAGVKERHDLRVKFYGAVDEDLAALRAAVALADQEAARALSAEGTRRSDDADLWYRTTAPEYSRRLLLEASPSPRAETPRERVAARLPAFYAASLIDPGELGDVRLLRLLAEHGFTPGQRRALSDALGAEQREVLAEYRVAMARRTLDGVQWDEAVWLLFESAQTSGRAQLLLATALSARNGPRSLAAALAATPKPMDASPLVSFAESHHAPRLRALAMNNAAALTLLPGGGADELDRVVRYGARAAELAPDEATRHCLWTLRETFVMREPLPCELLKEP